MKIANHNILSPIVPVQEGAERMARADETPKVKPDRVSLSNKAQEMMKKDNEKVEALASLVAEGNYKVDLDALAESIVRKEKF